MYVVEDLFTLLLLQPVGGDVRRQDALISYLLHSCIVLHEEAVFEAVMDPGERAGVHLLAEKLPVGRVHASLVEESAALAPEVGHRGVEGVAALLDQEGAVVARGRCRCRRRRED